MFLYSMPEARRYLNQDMSYFVGGYLLPAVVAIVTIIVITVCIRQMRSAMVFTACLIAVHTGEMVIHHFLDANRNLQYAEILESETRLPDQMEVVRETLRINQGRIVAVDGPNNPFVQMNMSRAWELPTIGGKTHWFCPAMDRCSTCRGQGISDETFCRENILHWISWMFVTLWFPKHGCWMGTIGWIVIDGWSKTRCVHARRTPTTIFHMRWCATRVPGRRRGLFPLLRCLPPMKSEWLSYRVSFLTAMCSI